MSYFFLYIILTDTCKPNSKRCVSIRYTTVHYITIIGPRLEIHKLWRASGIIKMGQYHRYNMPYSKADKVCMYESEVSERIHDSKNSVESDLLYLTLGIHTS
jgi:hypothetical protein